MCFRVTFYTVCADGYNQPLMVCSAVAVYHQFTAWAMALGVIKLIKLIIQGFWITLHKKNSIKQVLSE